MPSTDVASIRRARPEDYDQACRLSDALDALHRDSLPWLFKTPDIEPRSKAFFEDLLNREDSAAFVADVGHLVGIAFGFVRTAPVFPVFIQQRYGVLDGLVVDRAWRRRGIGVRLAKSVEKWAFDLGVGWVEINVYEFNIDARRFYESLGYSPLSTKLRKIGPHAA